MTADGARLTGKHYAGTPSQGCTPAVPAVRGVVRGHVVTAVGVLRSRITEPWTLNSLADEVHLSRSQLVRYDAPGRRE